MLYSFMPSEVARLVLGYMKEIECLHTLSNFLVECVHLKEYLQCLENGREYPTTIGGKSLLNILDEYCSLKNADSNLHSTVVQSGNHRKASVSLRENVQKQKARTRIANQASRSKESSQSNDQIIRNTPQAPVNRQNGERASSTSLYDSSETSQEVTTSDSTLVNSSSKQLDSSTPLGNLANPKPNSARVTASIIVTDQACSPIRGVISEQHMFAKPSTSSFSLNPMCTPVKDRPLYDDATNGSPRRKGQQPRKRNTPLNTPSPSAKKRAQNAHEEGVNGDDLNVLLGQLISNTALHERIADNINQAVSTVPEQPIADPEPSVPSSTSDESAPFTPSKLEALVQDALIKDIIHRTESDPVFEDLLSNLFDTCKVDNHEGSSVEALESEFSNCGESPLTYTPTSGRTEPASVTPLSTYSPASVCDTPKTTKDSYTFPSYSSQPSTPFDGSCNTTIINCAGTPINPASCASTSSSHVPITTEVVDYGGRPSPFMDIDKTPTLSFGTNENDVVCVELGCEEVQVVDGSEENQNPTSQTTYEQPTSAYSELETSTGDKIVNLVDSSLPSLSSEGVSNLVLGSVNQPSVIATSNDNYVFVSSQPSTVISTNPNYTQTVVSSAETTPMITNPLVNTGVESTEPPTEVTIGNAVNVASQPSLFFQQCGNEVTSYLLPNSATENAGSNHIMLVSGENGVTTYQFVSLTAGIENTEANTGKKKLENQIIPKKPYRPAASSIQNKNVQRNSLIKIKRQRAELQNKAKTVIVARSLFNGPPGSFSTSFLPQNNVPVESIASSKQPSASEKTSNNVVPVTQNLTNNKMSAASGPQSKTKLQQTTALKAKSRSPQLKSLVNSANNVDASKISRGKHVRVLNFSSPSDPKRKSIVTSIEKKQNSVNNQPSVFATTSASVKPNTSGSSGSSVSSNCKNKTKRDGTKQAAKGTKRKIPDKNDTSNKRSKETKAQDVTLSDIDVDLFLSKLSYVE